MDLSSAAQVNDQFLTNSLAIRTLILSFIDLARLDRSIPFCILATHSPVRALCSRRAERSVRGRSDRARVDRRLFWRRTRVPRSPGHFQRFTKLPVSFVRWQC